MTNVQIKQNKKQIWDILQGHM